MIKNRRGAFPVYQHHHHQRPAKAARTRTMCHRADGFMPIRYPFQFAIAAFTYRCLSLPSYPPRLRRLSALSFSTPLSSLSSASMDSPPEGYRRNVGICLISPSKKVDFDHLCLSIISVYVLCRWVSDDYFVYVGFVLDFCCFQAWYTGFLANAPGSDIFRFWILCVKIKFCGFIVSSWGYILFNFWGLLYPTPTPNILIFNWNLRLNCVILDVGKVEGSWNTVNLLH